MLLLRELTVAMIYRRDKCCCCVKRWLRRSAGEMKCYCCVTFLVRRCPDNNDCSCCDDGLAKNDCCDNAQTTAMMSWGMYRYVCENFMHSMIWIAVDLWMWNPTKLEGRKKRRKRLYDLVKVVLSLRSEFNFVQVTWANRQFCYAWIKWISD